MNKNNLNTLPIYNPNISNSGPQKPISISNTTQTYSSHTENFIGRGPFSHGIKTNPTKSHYKNGLDYHVIEFNPVNNSYIANDSTKSK
jgi:hypothetical protein